MKNKMKEIEKKYERYGRVINLPKCLQEHIVTPHPIKELLKEHKIAIGVVANYLGVTYGYTCNMLNGHFKVPPHHEKKLRKLIESIMQEAEDGRRLSDLADLEGGTNNGKPQ